MIFMILVIQDGAKKNKYTEAPRKNPIIKEKSDEVRKLCELWWGSNQRVITRTH